MRRAIVKLTGNPRHKSGRRKIQAQLSEALHAQDGVKNKSDFPDDDVRRMTLNMQLDNRRVPLVDAHTSKQLGYYAPAPYRGFDVQDMGDLSEWTHTLTDTKGEPWLYVDQEGKRTLSNIDGHRIPNRYMPMKSKTSLF